MNWADNVIVIILGLSAVISIWRGFMREMLSLLGWVASFFVALTFNGVVADALSGQIESLSFRRASAYLILFVMTLMVVGGVNVLISKFILKTGLTGADRMLGILFGLARGLAVVTVLIFGAALTAIPEDAWWQESIFVGHFQRAAEHVHARFPYDVTQQFTLPSVGIADSAAAREIVVPLVADRGK